MANDQFLCSPFILQYLFQGKIFFWRDFTCAASLCIQATKFVVSRIILFSPIPTNTVAMRHYMTFKLAIFLAIKRHWQVALCNIRFFFLLLLSFSFLFQKFLELYFFSSLQFPNIGNFSRANPILFLGSITHEIQTAIESKRKNSQSNIFVPHEFFGKCKCQCQV